jgi:hypothetical protein
MSASGLLHELEAAGVSLHLAGDQLRAEIAPGATLNPFRDAIRQYRLGVVALMRLQDEIVSAAAAAQTAFDRQYYDDLWRRWYALLERETAS